VAASTALPARASSLAGRPCTGGSAAHCARAPEVNRKDPLDAEQGEGTAHLGEPRGRCGHPPSRGGTPSPPGRGGEANGPVAGGENLPARLTPRLQVADVPAVLGSQAVRVAKIGRRLGSGVSALAEG